MAGRITLRYYGLSEDFLTLQEEYFGMLSDAYRCFRNLTVTEPPSDVETDADSVFSSPNSESSASSTHSTGSAQSVSRYRQRVGRDGRVYVDRTLTSDEKDNLGKMMIHQNPVLEERWKFDPRVSEDEKPVPLNEFSIEYNLLLFCSNMQSNFLPSKASSTSTTSKYTRYDNSNQFKWHIKPYHVSSSTKQSQ